MARVKALSAFKMAKRICDREDNIYNKKLINRQVVTDILRMYMDECRKALIDGERIEITKVGTIIPEVKTHEGNFNLPMCNKDGGNPPSTKLKITRNNLLFKAMNNTLIQNIENGIYGLKKLPFTKQQLNLLIKTGYITEDAEKEEEE